MNQCPFCRSSVHFVLNKYSTDILGKQWKANFGFDPFLQKNIRNTLHKNKCVNCRLIYYDPQFFGDNKFYEKLSLQKWYYEDDKWEFYEAIKIIEKYQPRSILEIGCGTGMFLEKISSMIDDVEGFDINEDAVNACRAKGLKVSIADITLDEFTMVSDKKYDMIILFEVLEHLQNVNKVFNRIRCMLNDNGLLLIATPNPEGYFKFIDVVLLDMPPHHNTAWSNDVFNYISRNEGYDLMYYSTEPLRYVHYVYYLSCISRSYSNFCSGIVNKLLNKLSTVFVRLMAPFYFVSDQKKILGQTHLVVFKKLML